MTRFLSLDLLRANEAPFWPGAESAGAQPRAVLIADWTVGPDGRPVCRWQIDDDTDPEG